MTIIPEEKKWYQGKTPLLQIEILKLIAEEGFCNRGNAEKKLRSYYADIHSAFKTLEDKELIEKFKKLDVDKPRLYFILTLNGLETFLEIDNCKPYEFLKALLWFCILNKKEVSKNEFSRLCRKYYLKFLDKNLEDVYLQSNLVFFDQLYRKYDKAYLSNRFSDEEPIPDSRKVLECLALNRNSTINKISKQTRLDANEIDKVLGDFSLKAYSPKILEKVNPSKEDRIEEYLNFLQHIVIRKSSINGIKKYELSLVGVIFTMAMFWVDYFLKEFNLDRVQPSFYGMDLRGFLYRIADNYKDKLPLILDKLSKLRTIKDLNINIEHIFNPVFNGVERSEFFSAPLDYGGIREIYDLIIYNTVDMANKLFELYDDGQDILKLEYQDNQNKKNKYINFLKEELEIISIYLDYTNIDNLVTKILENPEKYKQYELLIKEQNIIEDMLSKEITFLLYINLIKQAGYSRQWSNKDSYFLDVNKMREYGYVISLDELVRLDEDIKKQFLLWFNDALKYNNKIKKNLLGFSDELQKYLQTSN